MRFPHNILTMLFDPVVPSTTLGRDRLLLFISLISFQKALSFLHKSFLASGSFLSKSSFPLINLIALIPSICSVFHYKQQTLSRTRRIFFKVHMFLDTLSYCSDANSFPPGRLRCLPFDRFLVFIVF